MRLLCGAFWSHRMMFLVYMYLCVHICRGGQKSTQVLKKLSNRKVLCLLYLLICLTWQPPTPQLVTCKHRHVLLQKSEDKRRTIWNYFFLKPSFYARKESRIISPSGQNRTCTHLNFKLSTKRGLYFALEGRILDKISQYKARFRRKKFLCR